MTTESRKSGSSRNCRGMLALFRAVGKTCMSFRHSCNTIEMVLQLNVFSATVESVSVSCADHLLAKRRATFPPSATLPKWYISDVVPRAPLRLVLLTIGPVIKHAVSAPIECRDQPASATFPSSMFRPPSALTAGVGVIYGIKNVLQVSVF
jgi:hypothetical protein